MLIEFSVENFRSFRDMQTLHMQAAPIKSKNQKLDEHNVFAFTNKLSVVKCKVIYGANASGKSNLVKAITAFFRIFRSSLQDENTLKLWVTPYLMDTVSIKKPVFFQIQFRTDGRSYRYGFEATQSAIVSEWLYSSDSKGPESYHFRRDEKGIETNPRTFKEGARLIIGKGEMPPLYRANALFLPLVAAFNGPTALKITRYFFENYAIYSGIEDNAAKAIAIEAFSNDAMRKKMADVLKRSDLGIEDLGIAEIEESDDVTKTMQQKQSAEGKKTVEIMTKRRALDEDGRPATEVPFFLNEESYGTQKLFWLSPFLIGTLEKGGILIVDEFGSSLHVKLIRAIIDLFHSPVTNPHNAQLIVATHDTHLMDQRLFRRDQIVFVEKKPKWSKYSDRFGRIQGGPKRRFFGK
jgi:AAA15 family ATPase/GTPase